MRFQSAPFGWVHLANPPVDRPEQQRESAPLRELLESVGDEAVEAIVRAQTKLPSWPQAA
jgi:hypothetical protein